MTRKLRRRPNDPPPVPDKRRKPLTTTLTFTLDDRDIDTDLRLINRARPPTLNQPRKNQVSSSSTSPYPLEAGAYFICMQILVFIIFFICVYFIIF